MVRVLMCGAALACLSACGAATENSEEQTAEVSGSVEAGSDRELIIKACRSFETATVCACIADEMSDNLDGAQLKSVASIMDDGVIVPEAIKNQLAPADRSAFDAAVKAWNNNCELN